MELEKYTKEQALQLQARSKDLIVTLSDPEKFREVERSLTIQKIVDNSVSMRDVIELTSFRAVAQTLDIALTKLVASVNVSQNLNDSQIKVIVEDLMDKYKNESIEDFILVFKKARQGEFGIIYHLHSAVIFGWMEFYLEEKYQIVERKLMLEKDSIYNNQAPARDTGETEGWELFKRYAAELKEQKIVRPITDQDVLLEGQATPKPKRGIVYPISPPEKEAEIQAKIELGRKIHELSKQHPGKSLEELKAMVTL